MTLTETPTAAPEEQLNQLIDEIALQFGIQPQFHDVWGKQHIITAATKKRLLAAMGVVVEDDAGVEAARRTLAQRKWRTLPPVVVRRHGDPLRIPLCLRPNHPERLGWRVWEEYGAEHQGYFDLADLVPLAREDGYLRYEINLRVSLPLGYHRLQIVDEDTVSSQQQAPTSTGEGYETTLCLVPARCYQPEALADGRRVWGPAVQLYGLRSDHDWGIGDFGSLAEMVELSARLGAEVVGLNPLHALFPHNPEHSSPYSPSSRLFLNVLYIDLEAAVEFQRCEEALRTVRSPLFRERLEHARKEALVDYAEVARLKRPVFEQLYQQFRSQELALDTERAQQFRQFVSDGGDALLAHTLYEALQDHFHRTLGIVGGWLEWPIPYRHPCTEEVGRFARDNAERVEFYQYLQWLAYQQLEQAAELAAGAGLGLGLYLDYAVSVDRSGAEVWANQDIYALGASAGAPPDDFSLQGQDWGLPPMSPARLRELAYRPFIAGLRRNMRHAGALRIDHVMGLMRLYWVPSGRPATEGAYVHYPFEEMMGVVALESQRNKCLVIGEDLGTVPDEVREAMQRYGMLSYCPLLFERTADGGFKRPAVYPASALVAATTHDLPTLQGYWTAHDIRLRASLGLFPEPDQVRQQLHERTGDRRHLLRALQAEKLLPSGVTTQDASALSELTSELISALHRYLARTDSKVMMVQWEDLLGLVEQANLPGTTDQHPNWRRKLPQAVQSLEQLSDVSPLHRVEHARASG
jgi:(1->4)-alpha-D-glucan 1-alpha-D-glucosylmutase